MLTFLSFFFLFSTSSCPSVRYFYSVFILSVHSCYVYYMTEKWQCWAAAQRLSNESAASNACENQIIFSFISSLYFLVSFLMFKIFHVCKTATTKKPHNSHRNNENQMWNVRIFFSSHLLILFILGDGCCVHHNVYAALFILRIIIYLSKLIQRAHIKPRERERCETRWILWTWICDSIFTRDALNFVLEVFSLIPRVKYCISMLFRLSYESGRRWFFACTKRLLRVSVFNFQLFFSTRRLPIVLSSARRHTEKLKDHFSLISLPFQKHRA